VFTFFVFSSLIFWSLILHLRLARRIRKLCIVGTAGVSDCPRVSSPSNSSVHPKAIGHLAALGATNGDQNNVAPGKLLHISQYEIRNMPAETLAVQSPLKRRRPHTMLRPDL
jgi:hypothetical protein